MYNSKLNRFVTTTTTHKNTQKVNNFDTKYKSFAEATKQTETVISKENNNEKVKENKNKNK